MINYDLSLALARQQAQDRIRDAEAYRLAQAQREATRKWRINAFRLPTLPQMAKDAQPSGNA